MTWTTIHTHYFAQGIFYTTSTNRLVARIWCQVTWISNHKTNINGNRCFLLNVDFLYLMDMNQQCIINSCGCKTGYDMINFVEMQIKCNMEPASVIALLYVIVYLCHIRGSWVIEMVGVCEQVRCFIQRLCSVKSWLKPNSLESMNFERFWTRAKRWLTPKLYLIIYQTLSLNVVPINQCNYLTWDLGVSNHVEYVS